MLIENVSIKNFGILKDVSLDFSHGINLIMGENGQGKSHILKAIALMLIDYKGKAPKYESLVNWDAKGFELAMMLSHADRQFDFQYGFSGSLSPSVSIDGNVFQGSDAKKELAKYFDPALCRAAIMSFQGSLDLVDATPSVRLENLKRIYDLDFSKESKEIDDEVKALKNGELRELDIRVSALQSKEYEYLPLVDLPWDEETQKRFEQRLLEIQSNKQAYELLVSQSQELQEEVLKKKALYDEKRSHKEEVENELKEVTKIAKTRHIEFEREISILKERDYEADLRLLTSELEDITLDRPPKNPSDEEIESYKDESLRLRTQRTIATSELESAEAGVCPKCKKPFTTEEVEDYRRKLEETENELSIVDFQLSKLMEERKAWEVVNDANKVKQNVRDGLLRQIESEKKNIKVSKERDAEIIENKEHRIKVDKERIKTVKAFISDDIQDLNALTEQIAALSSKKSRIDMELEAMREYDPEEEEKLKSRIETFRNVEQRNLFIQDQNDKTKKQEKKDKKELGKLIAEQKEKMAYLDYLVRASVILKKEFPNYVIGELRGSLEAGINDLIEKVYEGRYRVSLQETRSGIEVVYGKKNAPTSIAGGFEQELFNMGYKSAFSQIADLGVLFLDEVDSYATVANSQKLFEALGHVMKDGYEQVFVVTHKQEVQETLINEFGARAWIVDQGKVEVYV